MKLWGWLTGAAALGAGTLLYGALFETRKLTLERRTLRLRGWPEHLDGYRIALIADTHVRDRETIELTQWAIEMAQAEDPDIVILAGDMIAYWKPRVLEMLEEAYAGLSAFSGRCLAIPGNHDYFAGDPSRLLPVLEPLGVRLLRNEVVHQDGIEWIGIDSEIGGQARPYETILQANPIYPMVVLWHEGDMVDHLPRGPELMLAGHSHGGQFVSPWGWAPTGSYLGRKYLSGFFPRTPVPLYVSRGVATTGPPARLFCRPEVSLLTLRPFESEGDGTLADPARP